MLTLHRLRAETFDAIAMRQREVQMNFNRVLK